MCAFGAPGARADPSSLDQGFGVGGTVFTSIGKGNDAEALALAATADGGEVAAGFAIEDNERELALTRYSSNGAPDSAFGSAGVVLEQLGKTFSQANAVAVLPNGDIAITGEADGTHGEVSDVLVALYSAAGKLIKKSLFEEGKDGDSQANAIALAPGSEELYVAGQATEGSAPAQTEMFLVRVNASTGATSQSSLITAGDGKFAIAHAIAISGSDVIVAGEAENESVKEILLAERTTSGASVSGFGKSGAVLASVGSSDAIAYGVTVSGGRIVVGGDVVSEGSTDALLVAFNPSNGELDKTFGSGGITALPAGDGENTVASAITSDSSGDLLIAGKAAATFNGQPANEPFLARLSPTGVLDGSFSPTASEPGTAVLENGDTDGGYTAMYVQPNGEIVTAGEDGADENSQSFLLARYLGPLSTGGGSGPTPTAPSTPGSSGTGGPGSSSTGTSPTTCTTEVKTFGVLQVRACFITQGTRILATGDIDADGLSIVPSSCTEVVFDQAAGTIQSACNQGGDGEVAVSLSGIPLYRGALSWSIPASAGDFVGDLEAGAFSDLKGFAIVGQISLEVENGGIDLNINTELPAPFDSIHGKATLRANLEHGLELSSLDINVEEVWLGPVDVKKMFVDYEAATDTWEGGAEAELPEPLGYGIKSSAAFQNGDFKYFEAKISGLNVPLGSAVFLQEVGFAAQANPFGLEGEIGLSLGPELAGAKAIGLTGRFVLLVPNPGWDIRLEGKASVVEVPLASGYVEIDSKGGPPNIFFGGGINFEAFGDGCDAFCAKANLEGWIDLSNGTFDAYAMAEVGFLDVPLLSGEVDVSSKAISACTNFTFLLVDVSVGGAYEWGGHFHPLGDVELGPGGASCDLGPYRPTAPAQVIGEKGLPGAPAESRLSAPLLSSSALALPGDALTLPAGQRGVMWQIKGSGAVPAVTVTEPDGQQFSSGLAGKAVEAPKYAILQSPTNDSTYVLLVKPSAGRWVITPTGSVPIASISSSAVLPPPHVTAQVSGHGRSLRLRYHVSKVPGQTVSFVEEASKLAHPIATVSAASGTLHFTPADGAAGKRRIVAQILEGATVRKRMTVATYIAPPPPTLGRPAHVTIRRHGSSLLVSWHSVSGAGRYLLIVRESDGATVQHSVNSTHETLSGVLLGAGASVSVAAQSTAHVTGPAGAAKLAALTAPKLRKAPVIHGTAQVSHTLSCTTGTWSGQPTRYVTEWLAKGITIIGATHRTLRLAAGQSGSLITCEVTARNAEGFASASSRALHIGAASRPTAHRKGKHR